MARRLVEELVLKMAELLVDLMAVYLVVDLDSVTGDPTVYLLE